MRFPGSPPPVTPSYCTNSPENGFERRDRRKMDREQDFAGRAAVAGKRIFGTKPHASIDDPASK